MEEYKIMANDLTEISTTIREEKFSEYLRSTELANNLYTRIISNIKRNLHTECSLKYLKNLIETSIIIRNYPKRIIRKGTKTQSGIQFDSSIMCLLNPSTVTFSKVKITQYMCNPQNNLEISIPGKIEFQNNRWTIKNMKYQPDNKTRSSRTSTGEKCVILFKFEAFCDHNHIHQMISKKLFSDTVVTICHSHQETDCFITLFWDDYYRQTNSFQPEQLNFACIETSTFGKLIANFSHYCIQETQRSLTENNKNYLLKMVRLLLPSSDHITLDDFMRRPMQNSKLSFGKWLMSIIKMLKIPTIMPLWREGLIEGFISKDVQNILTKSGSFLLRFSERRAAIGVVLRSPSNQIDAWDPYTDAQLRTANLSNSLDDFPSLIFIRKANGDFLNCKSALTEFKDHVSIDDGYTQRGDITCDDFNFQDMEIGDEYNCNLDEIEQAALALLEYGSES